MYDIILAFLTAFTLTYFAIPSIIHVAKMKNLCDEPGERRSHTVSTPSLGGVAIFAGVIFSIILWTPFNVFGDLQYILCAFIIIFLVGARDDIVPVSPTKKLIAQIFATSILVFKSNVVITSMYGLFGIGDLNMYVSYALSIFTILVIINAFNLIDGINGLSGSIGSLISITFGTWFIMIDRLELAIIAFTLAGSTLAFLKYNFTPAKIFMGDTGSLLLGIVCSILAIKFLEWNKVIMTVADFSHLRPFAVKSVPAVAIGIMILPLFDTLRVFITRAARGRSPMSPDRNHIHHLLIDFGFTHMKATGILVTVNAIFIIMALNLQQIGSFNLIILILAIATLLTGVLFYLVRQKRIALSRARQAVSISNDGSVQLPNKRSSDKVYERKVSSRN